MNKSVIATIIVISLAVGFGVGFGLQSAKISSLETQIEEVKSIFPTTPEIRSQNGVVKEIKKDSFVMERNPIGNPFEDFPTRQEVLVTEETEIVRFEGDNETNIQLENIEVGENVFVEAEEDIKALNSFEATKVYVGSVPSGSGVVVPAGGPPTLPPAVPAD